MLFWLVILFLLKSSHQQLPLIHNKGKIQQMTVLPLEYALFKFGFLHDVFKSVCIFCVNKAQRIFEVKFLSSSTNSLLSNKISK
jgi:UDP-N-acetylglucosamine pyrophosphorylase